MSLTQSELKDLIDSRALSFDEADRLYSSSKTIPNMIGNEPVCEYACRKGCPEFYILSRWASAHQGKIPTDDGRDIDSIKIKEPRGNLDVYLAAFGQ